VPVDEVRKSAILAARSLIENDPAYGYVTARLLLHTIRAEVLGEETSQGAMATAYAEYFPRYIKLGIEAELLDPKLAQFDLASWAPRSTTATTCASTTSACRRCTTATSCTSATAASNCRRCSSCASPWASR
jgi:hypothetical protein